MTRSSLAVRIDRFALYAILVLALAILILALADRDPLVGSYASRSIGGGASGPTSEVTYQGILDMLRNANLVEEDLTAGDLASCVDVCESAGQTCVHAEHQYYASFGQWIFHPVRCGSVVTGGAFSAQGLHCWCAG